MELRKWEKYILARNEGKTVAAACRISRVNESTAYRFERNDPTSSGLEAASLLGITMLNGSIIAPPLSAEAKRALDDFAFFRRRYFGRESTAWQVRAAGEVLRAVESKDRDYICMNEPPGTGKSTLFTCDIPTWLICRDRTIRILIGSRTVGQAKLYVNRIKRALERNIPIRASSDDVADGLAFDADACLADDFGEFRPVGRAEKWTTAAFTVQQTDGVSLDDKEDTVSAFGQDSGFLGTRMDFVVWDDLVDRKNMRTETGREEIKMWWDTEAESRLEPAGTMLLQGQRIAANDLYRHVLDKKKSDETPKYRHVVYKAHYDENCPGGGEHHSEPWPRGCLLDPHRLPWEHLATIKANNPRSYEVLYQQTDGDAVGGLVEPAWITGDVDSDGIQAPGCLDRERDILEVPGSAVAERGWSFITVDPSPTEFWGIIWWLYDPETENRYIIDLVRKRLQPQQFLTMDLDTHEFSGIITEMHAQGQALGIPLQKIVVEINAAQRWLINQPYVQRWMDVTGVTFVPHSTTANKNDPKFGVESIGDLFRQGRIRIPWSSVGARNRMKPLVDETTRYPEHDTTDLVMSTWFGKLAVENLYTPRIPVRYQKSRPGWMNRGRGRAA